MRHASPSLVRRLTRTRFDVLLQDELVHPSLVFLNGWLRTRARYPIVTIVHLWRSSEQAATWLGGWCSATERRYLATVDAALYNPETTRMAVEALLGRSLPGVIAYPGGDHLAVERSETELAARARATAPARKGAERRRHLRNSRERNRRRRPRPRAGHR